MDKIKTYTVGLFDGFPKAFEILDKKVKELGDIEIKSIIDQYFICEGVQHEKCTPNKECLARTIVYRTIDDRV